MRYNTIIENYLQNLTSLQRIRVKTDPKYLTKEGSPEECPSYEGYILEEGVGKLKILILPPDLSIEEIPLDLIEYIADEDHLQTFKELKEYIVQQLKPKEGNPLTSQIMNSTSIEELDQYIKQSGISSDQLADLYSGFILH